MMMEEGRAAISASRGDKPYTNYSTFTVLQSGRSLEDDSMTVWQRLN